MFVLDTIFFSLAQYAPSLVFLVLSFAKFSISFRFCKCHQIQCIWIQTGIISIGWRSIGFRFSNFNNLYGTHTMRYVSLLPCGYHCLRIKLPDRRFFIANIFSLLSIHTVAWRPYEFQNNSNFGYSPISHFQLMEVMVKCIEPYSILESLYWLESLLEQSMCVENALLSIAIVMLISI